MKYDQPKLVHTETVAVGQAGGHAGADEGHFKK